MSALVISRLDFCNAILESATQGQLERLQKVQNHAARVIMKRRMRDHVTPLLRELHWLPIEYRIKFKIATFAYRHFDQSLPSYLSETLTSRENERDLRSNKTRRLHPPRKPNLKTVGCRSFGQIAPKLWNSLPSDLKEAGRRPFSNENLKLTIQSVNTLVDEDTGHN